MQEQIKKLLAEGHSIRKVSQALGVSRQTVRKFGREPRKREREIKQGVMVVHHERLNADRLVRIVDARQEPRVRAFWTSMGRWLSSDRRFARLAQCRRKRVDLLSVGTEFQIKRRGEDPRGS